MNGNGNNDKTDALSGVEILGSSSTNNQTTYGEPIAMCMIWGLRFRAAEIIHYPKIAPDFCADSRRGKGRIAVLCNPCRNAEAAQKDKQDGVIYYFRGP